MPASDSPLSRNAPTPLGEAHERALRRDYGDGPGEPGGRKGHAVVTQDEQDDLRLLLPRVGEVQLHNHPGQKGLIREGEVVPSNSARVKCAMVPLGMSPHVGGMPLLHACRRWSRVHLPVDVRGCGPLMGVPRVGWTALCGLFRIAQ